MESILNSIKKLLGLTPEQTSFDTDIIIHINTVFFDLNDLGVGPPNGFTIQDEMPIWSDFIKIDENFEAVKTYVYQRVKLLFDPPQSSALIAELNKSIDKFEWKLNAKAETVNWDTEDF